MRQLYVLAKISQEKVPFDPTGTGWVLGCKLIAFHQTSSTALG
jgi:hypothetical protein